MFTRFVSKLSKCFHITLKLLLYKFIQEYQHQFKFHHLMKNVIFLGPNGTKIIVVALLGKSKQIKLTKYRGE